MKTFVNYLVIVLCILSMCLLSQFAEAEEPTPDSRIVEIMPQ